MASTAGDIITGALLNLNSIAAGETLSSSDASVGLATLNDLLDSLSNDEAFVYTQVETLFQWITNQYQYSVGNPLSTNSFSGLVGPQLYVIQNVTNIPSDVTLGATITDSLNVFPAGTIITSIGTNSITLSNPAAVGATGIDLFNYTVPGNIPIARPLRFRSGFTRAQYNASLILRSSS